jgi:lysophospholipase L1-like esterase
MRRFAAVAAATALLGTALSATLPVGVAQAHTSSPATGSTSSHSTRYVAMGDSFSSGEGLFRYDAGTDTTADMCHRSPLAYGPLLSYVLPRDPSLSFVACSGAATVDLYRPNHLYPSEAPQLSSLTSRTRTVTLTLGGNDLGFAAVLGACIQTHAPLPPRQCSAAPQLTGAVALRLAALAGTTSVPPIVPMATVLTDIAARSPRATIYVGAYPELFGDATTDFAVDPAVPSGRSCTLLDTGVPASTAVLDYADAQFFNASTRQLNAVLSGAVDQVRRQGVRAEFVPVPVFAGHGLCDAKRSWINPLIPSAGGLPRPESIHPNLSGSLGYTVSFWDAMVGERPLPSSVRRQAGLH